MVGKFLTKNRENHYLTERYKEVAIDICKGLSGFVELQNNGNIHLMQDGAFVDTVMWIPRSEIDVRTLVVRNVHEALPRAIKILKDIGEERESRNGPVLVAPWPIMTVYEKPCERVLFWPERDANPFFHLYESLWMLQGRNDVQVLGRYAKRMLTFSDDGNFQHGAYGHRWRAAFNIDQLATIAKRLTENPDDRRCVLQIWDTNRDLDRNSKDLPCNLTATFQRGSQGELNLTIFCRSNDIIWGAYGANAVHFSILLEYMAIWIGCQVGTMTVISVNWHGYLDTLKTVENLRFIYSSENPYITRKVHHQPMFGIFGVIELWDNYIKSLLQAADNGFEKDVDIKRLSQEFKQESPAFTWYLMLKAHHVYKTCPINSDKYERALDVLDLGDQRCDWIVAGREWILRRQKKNDLKKLDELEKMIDGSQEQSEIL